jgi:hypothetical protein
MKRTNTVHERGLIRHSAGCESYQVSESSEYLRSVMSDEHEFVSIKLRLERGRIVRHPSTSKQRRTVNYEWANH